MSKFNFDKNLHQISQKQLEFISSVLEKQGWGNAEVSIQAVGKPGDNYVANVKRIIAENNGETFKMIAKIAPTIELFRNSLNVRNIFYNEHLIYTEVLPKFSALEESSGLNDGERLRYATCYGTLMDQPDEVILIEDLEVSGFTMLDRFNSLTDNDTKLVLKDFAKLHSLSYAWKEKEPEVFDGYKNKLSHFLEALGKSPEMVMFFAQTEVAVTAMTEKEEHKIALKGVVGQFPILLKKLSNMDRDSRFSVMQQGDAWINNIMFKLEDGQSTQCCMIDYQQARINSPAADLLYMIFNCSDYETRKKHFYEWIEFYHSELDRCLHNFGLKANYVYPRDQLDADLKRHGKLSLSQSVIMAANLVRESANAAKMKEVMDQGGSMNEVMSSVGPASMDAATVLKFNTRIEGLVDSHRELGLV